MHLPSQHSQSSRRSAAISVHVSFDFLCPLVAQPAKQQHHRRAARRKGGFLQSEPTIIRRGRKGSMVLLRLAPASTKGLYPRRICKTQTSKLHITPSQNATERPLPLFSSPAPKVKHYLFGYGSLINPQSRLRTVPTRTFAIPVLVHGLERSWSYNCTKKQYTAVGVRRAIKCALSDEPATCNGVLIPIENPHSELPKLDDRESNYIRSTISLSDISFLFPSQSRLSEDAIVWVYELPPTPAPFTPTPCTPIPQSYVDCILAGCLLYGTSFAHEFVRLTKGWDSGTWLNDRHAAIDVQRYVRNRECGETMSVEPDVVDRMLREIVPSALSMRVDVA
ncbi:hypothetical protein SpCBS45565_g04478 [Spizellomyces sp. 'palustris']|nr:hypothetical protein SpCBS45565_g04478 [Spizellomyces sp. 'palustris']